MSTLEKTSEFLQFKEDALRIATEVLNSRFDADDVVQEAFIKSMKHDCQFDSIAAKRAWFLQVVANQAKDHRLKEQRRRQGEEKVSRDSGKRSGSPQATRVEHREMGHLVIRALSFLEEKFRLPVLLHYGNGLTYPEVAAALNMRPATARVYAHRGIQKVRKVLGNGSFASGISFLMAVLYSVQNCRIEASWTAFA